jgi:N-acylglucosamine-6-phosphate 2-epimerase
MDKVAFFERIRGGLIVSCYAGSDYNMPFNAEQAMLAMATSVAQGGAAAIRVNLTHVVPIKLVLDIPVIGIEKVYQGDEMRITPTAAEVETLVAAGADAVAIDATKRPRFDGRTLEAYINELKQRFDIPLIGDLSTYEEAMSAAEYGIDCVGTTLSGYTPYSPHYGKLGDIPPSEPDYKLLERLKQDLPIPFIAEGRFNTPEKAARALALGAHAVVVGTAISNPQKLTELFCAALRQS